MIKAVALLGATGVGKSELALEVACGRGVPIISCDSMQVYRGLDIGTAKPGPEDRGLVSHYLIDCVSLPDVFSAARWAIEVETIIRQKNSEGFVPLIVGGTGLYLRALLEGLAEIPDIDPGVCQRLRQEVEIGGLGALYERLMAVDTVTAERLNPSDSQRVMRALSVFESTGRPISAWTSASKGKKEISCPVYVLEMKRDDLHQRLNQRFHHMLDAGWMEEVYWLLAQNLPDSHPVMRAVGYRQLLTHARGECPISLAIEQGITATRHYAKRQETWFRHQIPQAVSGDGAKIGQILLGAVSP